MKQFKYKIIDKKGNFIYRIFTLDEIEQGYAFQWINSNWKAGESHLERLSYVTDDKNGDPVFAGDKAKFSYPDGESFISKIIWLDLAWQIEGGGFVSIFGNDKIELLKDEK